MSSYEISPHLISKFEQITNHDIQSIARGNYLQLKYKKGCVFMYNETNCSTTCLCPQCANYREQLEESLQDEICDAGFYAQIANEAPTDELRQIITSIVGDEYGHARLQASLLGICPPPVSCPPDCPPATGNFEADVRAAIYGELGAVRRYAELARCAPNPEVRYLLMSILGDEYAHARIWNAMLLAPSLCNIKCTDTPKINAKVTY